MVVHIDYEGMGEFLRSAEMQAAMHTLAEGFMQRAIATAPVDENGPHPGRYKASFHVESGVRRNKTARAYGKVINDSPEAFFVEFGTKNNPRHRTLGKAFGASLE